MLSAKKFDSIRALNGISERTMSAHYQLYEGYVKKYNEISEKLNAVDRQSANQTFSDIRSLKTDLTFAIGGVKNHELYFSHLGGHGGAPSGQLLAAINQDFGSYDAWLVDIKAPAMAARGWAWLAYDRDWRRLFNYLGDAQNTFPVWNATPILAIDVYEHAYYLDFATKRADYLEAFFSNLNWLKVAEIFDLIKK